MSQGFQEYIAQTVRLCGSVRTPLEGNVSTEITVQDLLSRNIIKIHIHMNVTVPSVWLFYSIYFTNFPLVFYLIIHWSSTFVISYFRFNLIK